MTEDERKGVWTTESLRIHLTALLHDESATRAREILSARDAAIAAVQAQRDLFEADKVATSTAITKAESATEKRLDSMNEFRQSLADQSNRFMPRVETDAKLDALNKTVDALEKRLGSAEGKYSGMLAIGAGVVSALAAIGSVVAIFVALSRVANK